MYNAFVSIDLGRMHDFTAIVVGEEAVWVPEPPEVAAWSAGLQELVYWNDIGKRGWVAPSSLPAAQRTFFRDRSYNGQRPGRPPLLVRHLERVRGRSYVDVVAEVAALLARPPLTELSVALLVDAGGVGVAVLDLMRQQGLRPYSITATAGANVNVSEGGATITCPKRELVSAAQICLAEGRLRIAAGMEHAATLTKELQDYRVSISVTGHDSYDARSGEHDDLVFSAAMACWFRDWYSQPTDDAIAERQRVATQTARYA